MRRAISVILAAVLVTTPLELVLAQAVQQEAVSVQQTAPPDSSRHRLIGVPPVTDNISRLWEPLASEDVFADIFAEDGGPAPMPKGVRTVLTVIAAVAIFVVVFRGLYLLACNTGDGCLTRVL